MVGVEVILCMLEPCCAPDRVLRVSILTTSIEAFLLLTDEDLRRAHPAEGVTCGWYREYDPSGPE